MTDAVTVGLCGCGNMGAAVASQLARHVDLHVYDLDAERVASVRDATSATPAPSVAALAERCDHLVLCLPNPAVSQAVLAEAAPKLAADALVIETSTVNASDMRALAALRGPTADRVIDAAILAGVPQMYAGQALLLLGGDDAAIDAAEPIVAAMSAKVVRAGELGAGMTLKVANNAVSHAVMVVLIEAMSLVAASGGRPELFAELLADPDGGLIRPLTHRVAERVFGSAYDGGMPVEAALKDSLLAHAAAAEHGVPLFAIRGAHLPYELSIAAGDARLDYAALARLWEQWTGASLAQSAGPEAL